MLSCEDYQECIKDDTLISNDSICCTGANSCEYISNITVNNNNIRCDASYSCQYLTKSIKITGIGSGYFTSFWSAAYAFFNEGDKNNLEVVVIQLQSMVIIYIVLQ